MSELSDDDSAAFTSRMALLMFRGDEAGVEALQRDFVHAHTGTVGPVLEQVVSELMGMARKMAAAFERLSPEAAQAALTAYERDVFEAITRHVDDDGGAR
ncbi:hypothetical protein [Mycobacterium intracellulare]|uniref:hypothetical protein n=1 Tax=Mycobacterium intracellulare TaxID=1767 RepID=UPI00109EDF12|nr:hypothetical protein [Mycobacterium intracellulare]